MEEQLISARVSLSFCAADVISKMDTEDETGNSSKMWMKTEINAKNMAENGDK